MRLSFLFRTDCHTADKGPPSWKADYTEECFDLQEQVGILAAKHRVTAVLDGGDYFHVKHPTRNSHRLVAKVAQIHAKYPCPVYCIEGNHDISSNDLTTVAQQPLGVLYETGVFKHLREETFRDDRLTVTVFGVPYNPKQPREALLPFSETEPASQYKLVVAHALAAKEPPPHLDDFFNEPVFRYEDLIHARGPDVFMFGHWHKDQGVERIRDRWFVNQGALSRGALNHENLARIPQVTLIEVTPAGIRCEAIPLKVRPASEVFDLEVRAREDKEAQILQNFQATMAAKVSALKAVMDAPNNLTTPEQLLGGMEASQGVKDMFNEYLARVRK